MSTSNEDQEKFLTIGEQLKRAGIPAELHIYGGAAHDFGVRKSEKPCSTWTQAAEMWMKEIGMLGRAQSK